MNENSQHTTRHLLDLDADGIARWVADAGEPVYRAKQLLQWVYDRGVSSFDEMTNLSASLRVRLSSQFVIYTSEISRRAESRDGTVKLLLRWPDGATSECVLIPSESRRTACISSQVGCPAGCRFCASGIGGLERQLTTGEIVEQAMRVSAEARAGGERLSHVVFMGIGEPLANYDAVMRAVRTLNAPWGPNIGARKITISTVGLPRQIRRLAGENLQLNLALSLHAPNDALRQELIPWAEKITLDELADACRHYFDATGREITLEYILLAGVNDRAQHARQLVQFCRKLRCNVNLLRYNPVEGLGYDRPSSDAAHAFAESLRGSGVNAHIRTSRGLDINAACGQLRRKAQVAVGNISEPRPGLSEPRP